MGNLSETLKQEAVSLGLCKLWTDAWGDCDQQELIDKFKNGLDFILKNDWPKTNFITSNFDRDLLHDNLIYVDEHIDIKDAPNGIYVLNGKCSGILHFGSWAAATVYIRHNTNVTIIAEGFAKVFVRVYDEAKAEAAILDEAVIHIRHNR